MGLPSEDVREASMSFQHLILHLEQSQYLINIGSMNFREEDLQVLKDIYVPRCLLLPESCSSRDQSLFLIVGCNIKM